MKTVLTFSLSLIILLGIMLFNFDKEPQISRQDNTIHSPQESFNGVPSSHQASTLAPRAEESLLVDEKTITNAERTPEPLSNNLNQIELSELANEEEIIFYDKLLEKLIIKDRETGEIIYETQLSEELLAQNLSGSFKTNDETYQNNSALVNSQENLDPDNNTFTLLPNEDEPEVLILNENGEEKIIHIE
ncbi:hypothetical protein EYS14_05895 [Alteromonadaceae bacterium M269]|nr:hypothetical protein EYS14_05895 [Alteromonadaceae bacterium M269]